MISVAEVALLHMNEEERATCEKIEDIIDHVLKSKVVEGHGIKDRFDNHEFGIEIDLTKRDSTIRESLTEMQMMYFSSPYNGWFIKFRHTQRLMEYDPATNCMASPHLHVYISKAYGFVVGDIDSDWKSSDGYEYAG